MEYRYGASGRQRYLVRPLDPQTLTPLGGTGVPPVDQWHDYDGDEIWGDYTVSLDTQTQMVNATDTMSHVPGMAQFDRHRRRPTTSTAT